MALLVSVLSVASKDNESTGKALISFPETVYDFGMIMESNGAVSHTFHFTNDGDGALVIISASAQCGCTRPQYTARPVNPGKSGEVKVTFLPEGYSGEFTKQVTVKTNDPSHKKVKLTIKGNVVPQTR